METETIYILYILVLQHNYTHTYTHKRIAHNIVLTYSYISDFVFISERNRIAVAGRAGEDENVARKNDGRNVRKGREKKTKM